MVTKTFKAESTFQTLQLVQEELGAEAIVVSMREIPDGPLWNPWKKSAVEVVAAMPEDVMGTPKPRAISQPSQVEFVEEMPEIEWEIPATKKPIKLPPPLKLNLMPIPNSSAPVVDSVRKAESAAPSNDRYTPPSLKKIQQQLIHQGVENSLIDGLLNLALETLSPATLADAEVCKRSIIQLMGAELRVQKGAGAFTSSNVMCVVGASGSGKTSVIAKLAMFFRQNLNKSVTWVCADTVRMGAIAEAKTYTDALGLELKLVYTPQDLKEIVRAPQANELFLVDTPGYNPCNEKQMVELGALLSEIPGRCTYLVTPATAKEADLFQLSASLGIFHLDGLIITKLDETHNFGGLYNFTRKNQIPLGYFTTGRETSSHLEAADPARLVSALFGKEWNK
jgi:flagellar biosynthesis protein FlhF